MHDPDGSRSGKPNRASWDGAVIICHPIAYNLNTADIRRSQPPPPPRLSVPCTAVLDQHRPQQPKKSPLAMSLHPMGWYSLSRRPPHDAIRRWNTLDALPLDLSRTFADLRELDAVLSSSMQSITHKIGALTTMIEEGKVPKDERLWLLQEIAEEAGRLKLGGEDKIRVACQAADNLRAHNSHMRALTDTLPGFETSYLIRKTEYPHVSPQSFMPVHATEHGRRRRGQGSLLTVAQGTTDPSPAKRKRVVNAREEDIDIGSVKSPRKDLASTTGRGRVNGRVKKCVVLTLNPLTQTLIPSINPPAGQTNAPHPPQNLSTLPTTAKTRAQVAHLDRRRGQQAPPVRTNDEQGQTATQRPSNTPTLMATTIAVQGVTTTESYKTVRSLSLPYIPY
ncbi:hypothetical protein NMY22_g19749 [Coprinellus aureogranulatus]|nr:hypothetical protein NMY22_g19749 [Coprinellus aureogranulatus]